LSQNDQEGGVLFVGRLDPPLQIFTPDRLLHQMDVGTFLLFGFHSLHEHRFKEMQQEDTVARQVCNVSYLRMKILATLGRRRGVTKPRSWHALLFIQISLRRWKGRLKHAHSFPIHNVFY